MTTITILLVLWIHILSAIIWLGGVIILERIIIPTFLKESNVDKSHQLSIISHKYSLLIIISNIFILLTGLYLVYTYDLLNVNQLLTTIYGNFLIVKILLYFAFTFIGVLIGKNLSKIELNSSNEKAYLVIKKTIPFLRLEICIGLIIVFIAVILRFSASISL